MSAGEHAPIRLSYHLLAADGRVLRHDNERSHFPALLPPGDEQEVILRLTAPAEPGRYRVEIDVVWENVAWFKSRGSPTALVDLLVRS